MENQNKINEEIEVWKKKYIDLNEEYGKMADTLKRFKNKNKILNNIYNKYKTLFGEIEQ